MVTTNYHPCGSGYCLQSPMDQFAIDISMMESDLHHPVAVLGRVCSTFISAKPKYLDQSLCLGLADCLNFTAQMLTVVQRNIDSVVQKYPDIFRELYIIAYRAHLLVERCCSEEWLRILFLQACTSHKEEALDVIDDLEWCITEIWKISCLPRLPPQALLRFKKLLKECEGFDRSELVKQLERHALVPLERQELQLTKYLLERIKVQVVASTPSEIAVSLDYRNHILAGANGFTASVFVGEGSSAKVYKTTFLEIQCAKKVQTTVSKDQLQELAKQARKLATLSHPHVIKLLGFYEDRRTDEGIFEGHWLMECMDGDLRSNISRCLNQYSISVDILLQIAKGVRYLHDNDVAHRDLKCDNILVSQSPVSSKVSTSAYKDYFHIKVTDFDQSKFFTSNCSDLQVQSKNHVGSTPWRAPEAFTEPGKSMVNPKSADSYSFAMTCFELLSGENPFSAMPGINWSKAKEALVAGRRPPLPKDCPELLRELIVECWQTNPVQRPAFTEICRRLQDVRAVLLTGSLTQRKKQRGAPSFLRHNAQRIVSMFKTVRKVTTSRKRIPVPRLTMPETEAPFTHTDDIQNVQQRPEVDLYHIKDRRTLKTPKVVVGLDLGTTHTGVAYAMVSNPDETFTISHWPLVGEEAYHCKTLTATYKSSPNGDCLWGYPARREYSKNVRGNGQSSGSGLYFGELKQSLSSNDFDSGDHQPIVDYLRELGKFVLGYLQREYPLELLEMDLLRWCVTVPSNCSSDLKQKLGSCMVNAGLVRGQIDQGNFSSSFNIFLESDAAACYCNGCFAHVNMKKGDRLCVLDVGSGNIQCVVEDWEGSCQWSYDDTQKIYGVRPACVESLVQENFVKFILGKEYGCSSFRQLLRGDPSVWMSLLDELEALKVDMNHSIKIPSNIMMHFEKSNLSNRLQNPTVTGDQNGSQCALNYTHPSDELLPSSLDTKSIFKPLVDRVVSFLQEQLQFEPNVQRLFVVGGYVKHVYFMEEIRKAFPHLRIDIPKNPGSAVCKGAVALGLKLYFESQAGLVPDASFNSSQGGEQGTNHDDMKSDGDNDQGGGQPESSEKANLNSRSYPRVGGTSDTKGAQQVDAGDQNDFDSCREKMLVTLDFGTSQMGFAYGFESQPGEITVCTDDQRRSTDLYYKLCDDTLRLHSCGEKAKNDVREDLKQQPDDSQDFVPALGAYVSKPKLHLVVDNADPEVELHLPAGLVIDDVISDCLREYGHFILEQLQHKFGNDFKLHHIQWCLLVPSCWGENTKRRVEACMISAGLLRGPISVDGSPYPLVTILEAEAAATACIKHLSLCKGYRFLVASIGAGTLDMVIQEWVGEFGMYDMKEVSKSSGGFYGSSCLDLNFLAFLSMKMGAWVSDYLEHFPLVLIDLMSQWECIKVDYFDECELKIHMLHLPVPLQNAWRRSEHPSATREAGALYESLELTSDDVKMIFEPVVQTILEQIAAQLATSTHVDALVVVGGFAKSPYLYGQIVRKFGNRCLLRIADTESVVLRGGVLIAQNPKGIRSRIARKTYGLGMRSTDLKVPGLCGIGEVSNGVERFRIDMEKGSSVEVDHFVESYHRPINCVQQKSMKFTLYSSVESYPRFTEEQSVTKEWDFVVHIPDSVKSKDVPKIRIRVYYGRSAVEVVAEAMTFGMPEQLPVTFVIGAHNVKKPLGASVVKKTYGVRSSKCFEMWDLPEYRNTHGVDQEDTCDFNFEIYIRRGTALDSCVSRTYNPIYDKQQNLSFTLYSSTDVSPRYVTDETAMEEGDFEVDILKGLYLDKDREISLRMCFTHKNIRISAVALNFAGEDRNLPIRLRYGNWNSQVSLTLARQLRMVPLSPQNMRGRESLDLLQERPIVTPLRKHGNSSTDFRGEQALLIENLAVNMDSFDDEDKSAAIPGRQAHILTQSPQTSRKYLLPPRNITPLPSPPKFIPSDKMLGGVQPQPEHLLKAEAASRQDSHAPQTQIQALNYHTRDDLSHVADAGSYQTISEPHPEELIIPTLRTQIFRLQINAPMPECIQVRCRHCQLQLAVPIIYSRSETGVEKLRCGSCRRISRFCLNLDLQSQPMYPGTRYTRQTCKQDGVRIGTQSRANLSSLPSSQYNLDGVQARESTASKVTLDLNKPGFEGMKSTSVSVERMKDLSGLEGRTKSGSRTDGTRPGSEGRMKERPGAEKRMKERPVSEGRTKGRSGSERRTKGRPGSEGRTKARSKSEGRTKGRSGSEGRSKGRLRSEVMSRLVFEGSKKGGSVAEERMNMNPISEARRRGSFVFGEMVREKRSISVERRISLLEEKIKVRSVAEERMKMRAILEKESKGQLGNKMKVNLMSEERKKGKSIFQEWPKRYRFGEWTKGISGKSLAEQLNDADISPPRVIPETTKAKSSGQSDVENWVQDLQSAGPKKWVLDLQSSDIDMQRQAAFELGMLAKHNVESRVTVANSGAIDPLVVLLSSADEKTQVYAVKALLNLSIDDNNKAEIAGAGAIEFLVTMLCAGTAEAMENAAATLVSLSVLDQNKGKIGASGAIAALVDLLVHGSPQTKKVVAAILFNLSIDHENKARIVHAGAVRPLVELMADPAAGMVGIAVAVLANLARIPEGRQAIVEHQGIPALVNVVEAGPERAKENAAATLLQLCLNSHLHRALVLAEGAIPPLVALSRLGTPRAKEKASAILQHFRERVRGGTRGQGWWL